MTEITISKQVLSQELGGETVLLDLQGEKYFGLDVVGTRIWQLLNEGHGRAQIVEILLTEYDVDSGTLERDVLELLERLEIAGLIEISP
jgi:hypothetical protein